MTLLSDPPIRLLAIFEQLFPLTPPQLVMQAPGREMWAAANVNSSTTIKVGNAETGAQTAFSYQSAKIRQTAKRRPLPTWARYLAGVTVLIDVPEMPGMEVVVCGNEPTGPRYDFALGILFAALWREVNGQPADPADLLEITERVRREYIDG